MTNFTGFLIVDFLYFLQKEIGKPNMVFEASAGGAGELIDRCLGNWMTQRVNLQKDTVYSYLVDVVKEKSLWSSLFYFIHSSIQQYLINVHHMPNAVLNTGNAGGN